MANSEFITQSQASGLENAYQANRYGSSSSTGFTLSNSEVAGLLSVSSNATVGFDFGADQQGNYKPVALAVDNSTGEELQSTKYYTEDGEITQQSYSALVSNYRNNRDTSTPQGQNGTLFERDQIQSIAGASAAPALVIRYARESDGSLNFIATGSSSDIGTVFVNMTRPRPKPKPL